jgi:O-antigen/teichoic acid export membrane protein
MGTFGLETVISRYVPPLFFAGDESGIQRLFANLLTVRLASAVLVAGAYLLIIGIWLRDLDRWTVVFMAGYVFVRVTAELFYSLFLGVNQAARRGMGEFLSRWIVLILLPIGFYLGGLRGACLGLFLSGSVVLIIGIGWAQRYVSWTDWRFNWPYLAPYLHFGLLFFAGGFLAVTAQHTGEPLVKIFSGDYVQIGYYGLAYNAYATIILIVPYLVQAFVPLFTAFWERGEPDRLARWAERLLRGLTVLFVPILFGALILGTDLVLLVFGDEYQPVVTNLVPMMLALLAMPLFSIARALSVVLEKPKLALAAALVQFGAFWGLGPLLIAWQGSLGACVAFAAAAMLGSGYFTWRIRRHLRYSLRPWGISIALGALFLPLVHLKSSWINNVGLYFAFLIGYGCLLFLLRITEPEELLTIWRFVRVRNDVEDVV